MIHRHVEVKLQTLFLFLKCLHLCEINFVSCFSDSNFTKHLQDKWAVSKTRFFCLFKLQAFLIYKRQISLFQILDMFISKIISLILRWQLGNEVYIEMNILAGGAQVSKIYYYFLITLLLAVLLTYHQLLASTIPNFTF